MPLSSAEAPSQKRSEIQKWEENSQGERGTTGSIFSLSPVPYLSPLTKEASAEEPETKRDNDIKDQGV